MCWWSEKMEFLNFIRHLSSVAADNALKMEELIFEDPSSALAKARIFAEEVINKVFQFEELDKNEEIYKNISNFSDRIQFLSRNRILTRDIEDWLHTIRKLGNKAVHQGDYNDINDALLAHKSMYKIAVWFYEKYSTESKEIHKYTSPKPPKIKLNELGQEIKQIKEILETHIINQINENTVNEHTTKIQHDVLSTMELNQCESFLLQELRKLQDSAKEAIENFSSFSQYKEYMHVQRQIQFDIENVLMKLKSSPDKPQLILLCGSVGDGKSHILSYLKNYRNDLLEDYEVFNDATESFTPSKNSLDTLQDILKDFSDYGPTPNKKVIIAINLGVLHNFISIQHKYPFSNLKKLIEESELFTPKITTVFHKDWLSIINFTDYQNYELTNHGIESSFFSELLKKVVSPEERNPFYRAYKLDMERNIRNIVHYNFELLQSEIIRSRIVDLIVQVIIKYKLVISARSFLNFVADILIPDNVSDQYMNFSEKIKNSLPFLLFNRKERSEILRYISELNPMNARNPAIDEAIIRLNTEKNWHKIFEEYINNEKARELFKAFLNEDYKFDKILSQISTALILYTYMTNNNFYKKIIDIHYINFINRLYRFNIGDIREIRSFYEEIKEAIFKWKGSPPKYKNYIYLAKQISDGYSLAQMLDLKPGHTYEKKEEHKLYAFKPTITIAFSDPKTNQTRKLEVDYQLYVLLQKIRSGYCPNKHDEEEAIKFVEFVEHIMNFGNKNEELLICFPIENKFYKLYRDSFGSVVFEKE